MKKPSVTALQSSSLVALVAMTILAGCTKFSTDSTRIVDTSTIQGMKLSPTEKAEKLALAGEQLLTPESFTFAQEVFNSALESDPKNPRALFYSKLLGPAMKLKGVMARVRPMLSEEEKTKMDSRLMGSRIEAAPITASERFFMVGPEDLKSEKDAQVLIDEVISAFDTLRVHLRDTKSDEFTINIPEVILSDIAHKECVVLQTEPGKYTLENCGLAEMRTIKVNRADKEMIQQIVAGMQVYLSLANAYTLDGVAELSRDSQKGNEKTSREVQAFLKKQGQWGVLRDASYLTKVIELGNDAIKGMRWIEANQSTLCPQGKDSKDQRVGHAISDGICIEDSTAMKRSLALAERILKGDILGFPLSKDGKEGQAFRAKIAAPLEKPVKDLKSLLPIETTECGQFISAPDKTLGGLLPDGDLANLFPTTCPPKTGALSTEVIVPVNPGAQGLE